MRHPSSIRPGSPQIRCTRERGSAKSILLAAVCFAVGAGAGGYWIHRMDAERAQNANQAANNQPAVDPAGGPGPQSMPTPEQRKNWNPPPAAPATAATIEEVKRAIPNFDTVSLEDGLKTLQRASLDQFAAAVNEIQAEVSAAEQQLSQARSSGSEADQQAALKRLETIQTAQTARLKEIAANNKAQLDAFKQLKSAGK